MSGNDPHDIIRTMTPEEADMFRERLANALLDRLATAEEKVPVLEVELAHTRSYLAEARAENFRLTAAMGDDAIPAIALAMSERRKVLIAQPMSQIWRPLAEEAVRVIRERANGENR